ncbi:DUF4384 domain-containing protein [bacterium]|nr:DUF4384 domain-containing protein [bacterium]
MRKKSFSTDHRPRVRAIAHPSRRDLIWALLIAALGTLILLLCRAGGAADVEENRAPARGPTGIDIRPPRDQPPDLPVPPRDYQNFRVSVWTDSSRYRIGEAVRIYYRATVDAYVYIFDTDSRGVSRQLFPNYYDGLNFARGGVTYSLPGHKYDLEILGPAGRERVEIIAVSDQYEFMEDYREFDRRQPFPYRRGGSREMKKRMDEANQRLGEQMRERSERGSELRERMKDREDRSDESPRDSAKKPPQRQHGIDIRPPSKPAYIATSETSFWVNEAVGDTGGEGTLFVSTTPAAARIYIDGEFQGHTTRVVHLPAGAHLLRLEKQGYIDRTLRIRIDEQQTERIHLRMTPATQDRWRQQDRSRPDLRRQYYGPERVEKKD